MRRVICLFCLVLLVPTLAFGESDRNRTKSMTDDMLNEYVEFYGDAIQEGMEDVGLWETFSDMIPRFRLKDLLRQLVRGRAEISLKEIGDLLLRWLLGEVYRSLRLMAMVLAASVLCAYLTGLQDGFGKTGITKAAYFACYMVVAGLAATAFYDTSACVGEAVENMALFMKMIVPIVITTLVASGAVVSASVFEPVLLGIIGTAVTVIRSLLIPLSMMTAALNVVNGVSDRFRIDRLIKFMNQCMKWGLSVMLTVFVSTAGIQSIASSGADGLTVKLTKFATSNLIPVVGGIMSESVETVMNCSVLIKNSVGVLGIVCLILIAVLPLLKIAAILLIFRLTAAAAEPVSEPRIVGCISALADSVSVLFSMLAAVAVMFVIILTIVIHAGNTAVLLGR